MREGGYECSLVQHINTEHVGAEIAVPYQFHYADLTMDLVKSKSESLIILDGLHVQPNTDFKHLYQLFNSL